MISALGNLGGFAYFNCIGLAGKNRNDLFPFAIDFFREDMGVGDDMEAVRDCETGPTKN